MSRKGRQVEPEGEFRASAAPDVAFAVGAVAAQDYARVDKARDVAAHGRAGHAVEAFANRLVRRVDDSKTVAANLGFRMKSEQGLQHGQVAVGQAEMLAGGG